MGDLLNAAQREAVEAECGPALIVAGPGTGKTRTLVERAVHLVESRDVPPESILAITFSNRAAREMSERIDAALYARAIRGRPAVCTFHRWGLRLLRENLRHLGLRDPLTVLSEEDAVSLMKRTAGTGEDPPEGPSERRILAVVDSLTDEELTYANIQDRLGEQYRRYQAAKRDQGTVDFNDLLLLPLVLLREDAGSRERYRRRWPHILVDEYQDVNALQHRLLRAIAAVDSDLFAIGDPDQGIYGFRGADVRYFGRFADDFPGARVIGLDCSYRSSDMILRASAAVLGPAALADKSGLRSGIAGPTVCVAALPTEASEAEHVVKVIEGLIGGTSHFAVDTGRAAGRTTTASRDLSFGDIAVLFRTHAAGDAAEEALGRSGIPVQRPARVRASNTPGLRPAIAALDYVRDPASVRTARRMLDAGLGGMHRKTGTGLGERLSEGFDGASDALAWLRGRGGLRDEETAALGSLSAALDPVRSALGEADLARALEHAARASGIGAKDLTAYPWPFLLAQAGGYSSLDDYLASLALDTDADFFDPRSEGVTLMTLHASKGLEWRIVFIVGCEEGLIPSDKEDANLDEERRLLYVGMTRARERLFLTRAESRMRQGCRERRNPSRFLSAVPADLLEIERPDIPRLKGARPDGVQLGLFD